MHTRFRVHEPIAGSTVGNTVTNEAEWYFAPFLSGQRPWGCPVVRMRSRSSQAQSVPSSTSQERDMERLRICSSAHRHLCLEEMLDVDIPDGHVWYGGPRRRVRVPFTSELRDEVRAIVREIRTQILTASLPEAPNDRRCNECQLRHHCLPGVISAPHRVSRYMDEMVFECAT